LGIGDWGLGIGDWPNPQSPIPNPQNPKLLNVINIYNSNKIYFIIKKYVNKNESF